MGELPSLRPSPFRFPDAMSRRSAFRRSGRRFGVRKREKPRIKARSDSVGRIGLFCDAICSKESEAERVSEADAALGRLRDEAAIVDQRALPDADEDLV